MKIITSDTVTVHEKRSILTKRFAIFETFVKVFPDKDEVVINIKANEWYLIDTFVSFLETPLTNNNWISLLTAAEYLCLDLKYAIILKDYAKKYLLCNGITVDEPITLSGISDILKNPKNKIKPKTCSHIYKIANFRGAQCDLPVVPGSIFCENCINRKFHVLRF